MFGTHPRPSPDRRRARRPGLEPLEGRELLSWLSTPPSQVNLHSPYDDHSTINSFGRNGDFRYSSAITRNEVDYYSFVAQRSGTYKFTAAAAGSHIDTVEALFDSSGRRLAYNDDAYPGTLNSAFSANLRRGQTYVVGVTNYSHSPDGGYVVTITSPSITAYADTGLGNTIYAVGSATLSGTALTLDLAGYNGSLFDVSTDSIQVWILDIHGRAIHSGSWVRSFVTSGTLVPDGNPSSENQTWTIDVSGFNLANASSVYIVVSS
jgi:hypothetical protein